MMRIDPAPIVLLILMPMLLCLLMHPLAWLTAPR
jgi:hypothetical protein